MANKNDKIGKWSLYGTIIGVFIIGNLYMLITDGLKSFILEWVPLGISVAILALAILIIILLPNKWQPVIIVAILLAFIHYKHDYSWGFTLFTAFLFVISILVDKKVENKRISKPIQITLIIGFLLASNVVNN